MHNDDHFIEIPFEHRHQCWFCEEPAGAHFTFPHQYHLIFDCSHPTLTLPSCDECYSAALRAKVNTIWQVKLFVKKYLLKKYKKDLAIGLNWTQQELANSGFEEGCFAGFQKSAWFMYEVAKQRVNSKGWPLILNGMELEQEDTVVSFLFDGVYYPSVEQAIEHYCDNFTLDRLFFRQLLAKLGTEQFSLAVRICRMHIISTPDEKRQVLKEVT